ncbi:DUF2497 domain-containing protein [Devosia sp.]|uniref:DUF2497 domain-containing protein n=1 Tax=Devosia sp. TaxID=1871048 RepID=UPI0032638746
MNKPATKEPSMDEILSSIRQIIADDDAAGVPRRPALQAAPPPMQATPARPTAIGGGLSDMLEDMEPLALSSSQILSDMGDDSDDAGPLSFDALLAGADEEEAGDVALDMSKLVVPDDIAFDAEDDTESLLSAFSPPEPEPEPEPAFAPPPKQQRSVEQVSPLPDPTLSRDMAEQLIEPATNAAVRSTFAKLNNLGLGTHGITIESMMRDMLRPMLKEWLDENLPSVVERMVEKEISRISRGGE